jgi:hypothetical protein
MTNNPKKRILDAFLREVYGNKTPPDQTEEILRRLEEADQSFASDSKIGVQLEQDILDFENDSSEFPIVKTENHPQKSMRTLNWISVAATLLFCVGLTLAIIAMAKRPRANPGGNDNVAKNVIENDDANQASKGNQPLDVDAGSPGSVAPTNSLASDSKQPNSNKTQSQLTNTNPAKRSPPSARIPIEDIPSFADNVRRADFASIKSTIDESMMNNWHVNVIATPELVSPENWMTRMFEKTLGRQPSTADFQRFETYLSDGGSRKQIAETLANGEEFDREFSHFWAEKFLALMTLKSPSSAEAERREELRQHLRESFLDDTPVDQVVAELLSATGSSDPSSPEFDSAISYWALLGPDANNATKQISRSLLGTEVRCAQCHTDSYFSQDQTDFLGLTAFVKGVRVFKSSEHTIVSEAETKRKNPGLFYEDDKGVAVYAPPKIAGLERRLNQKDSRAGLAKAIVTSDRFAMAMVNWVWKEIYGYGLVRDGQIGIESNSPHHQLLEELARQFVASDFNFRSVVKWAVMADSFSATTKPSVDTLAKDIPKYGGVPFFSYAYDRIEYDPQVALKRLVAAYKDTKGLTLATRIELAAKESRMEIPVRGNPNDPELKDIEFQGLKDKPNEFDFSDENAPDFAKGWGTESRMASTLDAIAQSQKLTFDKKLEHLYLFALDQKPRRNDIKRAIEIRDLQANRYKGDSTTNPVNRQNLIETKVLQDIWWAIFPR